MPSLRLFSTTLLVGLLIAAALAPAASASVTVTRAGGTLTVDTGTGTADGAIVTKSATGVTIVLYFEATVIDVGASGCGLAVTTLTCPLAAGNRLVLRTHDKTDDVLLAGPDSIPGIVEADLGPGTDRFAAEFQSEPVIVQGGDGADEILTGAGSDSVAGGAGPDEIDTRTGRDEIDGGSGTDQVSYATRAAPLRISLDGVANDGDPATVEHDNVLPSVERVLGGAGADELTGGDGADELHGLDGADRIDGRGGVDRLFGNAGADVIAARDGLAERVSCDAGDDSVTVDDIDTANACETVDSSPLLQPDRDGDGVLAPQDCDDLLAATRPGAFDTPENGRDEDCDGADGIDLDRDRDGWPRPLDCDDGAVAIHPGGTERFGDAQDEDCDGVPEPFPAFESQVRLGTLVYRTPSHTRVTSLEVTALDAADRVLVRCRGGGCPFKAKRPRPPAAGGDLDYDKPFKRARLKPGAKLIVTVTRADGVGEQVTHAIRDAKPPQRTRRCFTPLQPKAGKC